MSDAPRTDALQNSWFGAGGPIMDVSKWGHNALALCRQLERELSEARRDAERLDYLEEYSVIAKPGQKIRDAIDSAIDAAKESAAAQEHGDTSLRQEDSLPASAADHDATPECDGYFGKYEDIGAAGFARNLERQRNALRAEIERLRK